MNQSEPLTLTLGFSRSTGCVKQLWPQKRGMNIEYLQYQRAPIPLFGPWGFLRWLFPSANASTPCWVFFPGSPGSLVPGSLVPGSLVPGSLVPGPFVLGSLVPGSLVLGSLVPGSLFLGSLVPGSLVLFSWTAQHSSYTGIHFFFCQVQEDVCSHQSFPRSLSVPRDLIGIQNVKSHSRKEGRGTGSNKKDECLGPHSLLTHPRPRIHSLRSRRILHKFRVARSCRAPEKCQLLSDSRKDGADDS